jgi:hypothetical protein
MLILLLDNKVGQNSITYENKKGGQLSHVHQNGINNQESLDHFHHYFFSLKERANPPAHGIAKRDILRPY